MSRREPRPTGSNDPRMVLVPYQPGQGRRRLVRWLVSLVVTAAISLGAGYWFGMRGNFQVLEERSNLLSQVETLQKQVQSLQEDSAIYRHGSDLERRAAEQVRERNLALQNKVSELQEAVSFYKGIMAPGNDDKGLRIERLELEPTLNSRRFKFKLVMTQVADNSRNINGNVKMNLLGVRQGSRQSIPFDKLSKDWPAGDGAPFNFRYFQDIGGELVVPDGFTPEQVEVIAQSKGRKAVRLEKRFDWKVDEVTSDVGKG